MLKSITNNHNYIVKVGEEAAYRLDILHNIFQNTTLEFLYKAGLRNGMTALDVGCGIGNVSFDIAKIVGKSGKVYAIDRSEEQLIIAQKRAKKANITNLEFICCSAEEVYFLPLQIDFIYGRFILMHLSNARATLSLLYNLLKTGGIIAFEEPNMQACFAYPEFSYFDLAMSWHIECGKRLDLDFKIGDHLFAMINDLGMDKINFNLAQPIATDLPNKHIISLLTAESKNKYIEYNIAPNLEIEHAIKELNKFEQRKETYYGCARQHQVFGIKK